MWMDQVIRKLGQDSEAAPHVLASTYLQLAKLYEKSMWCKLAQQTNQLALRAIEYKSVEVEMDPREVTEIRNLATEMRSNRKFLTSSPLGSQPQLESNIQ